MAKQNKASTVRVRFNLPKKTPSLETIPNKRLLSVTILINLLTLGLVILIRSHIPPQIPLFYGLAVGDEQLAPTLGMLLPNLIALAIAVLNAMLALFIKNDYLQHVLLLGAFAVSLMATITTIKIIFLIASF